LSGSNAQLAGRVLRAPGQRPASRQERDQANARQHSQDGPRDLHLRQPAHPESPAPGRRSARLYPTPQASARLGPDQRNAQDFFKGSSQRPALEPSAHTVAIFILVVYLNRSIILTNSYRPELASHLQARLWRSRNELRAPSNPLAPPVLTTSPWWRHPLPWTSSGS
jgi:hypothetical protein